ncbi:MAG: hypothetical protein KHZ63_10395 [Actinomyces sp.]|nr:hypothetical protein [Actinomyces sp.]
MVDMTAWAELRESLREALDALENAKELIPWENANLCSEHVSLRLRSASGQVREAFALVGDVLRGGDEE